MYSSDDNHRLTRLLLALWDLGDAGTSEVSRGNLIDRAKRSREKRSEYDPLLEKLIAHQAIALTKDGKNYTLLPAGVRQLNTGLQDKDFGFDTNTGAKTVNSILRWLRQAGSVVTVTSNGNGNNGHGATIHSYEEFEDWVLATYDSLNRNYNLGDLVPIYRLRRELGDRVDREQFNEWLLEVQAQDKLQLLAGNSAGVTPDQREDALTLSSGDFRFYARRL